jgi:CBS domain containing-hemolysin-like protein
VAAAPDICRLPVAGICGHPQRRRDKISVAGWHFEIVDPDGRRIDKVLATRLTGT